MSRGATPCVENHVTPSCTRSSRSVYEPTVGGEATAIPTTALCPGATSAGSAARLPSHTAT